MSPLVPATDPAKTASRIQSGRPGLPAWGRTLGKRTADTAKVHLIDSGLAARLLRLTVEHLARRDPTSLTEFGHLLETFVVGELMKPATSLDGLAGWHHWRTYDGDEVDLVIERDDGRIVGFEVKAGTRVPSSDMRSLEKLRNLAGDAFIAGVAVYTGERSCTTGTDCAFCDLSAERLDFVE